MLSLIRFPSRDRKVSASMGEKVQKQRYSSGSRKDIHDKMKKGESKVLRIILKCVYSLTDIINRL